MLTFAEFLKEEMEPSFNLVQEGIPNPAFAGDKEIIKLDNMISGALGRKQDKQKLFDKLSDVYSKYEKVFKSVERKFAQMVRKETKKNRPIKVLTNIKKIDSVFDKAVERGKGVTEINDYVRGAILFKTKNEADEFVKRFLRRNRNQVVGYEEKVRGGDTTYGYYGSHHIDINIEGIIVELQIMTRKLWDYKKEAHEIYTKNRSSGTGPDAFDQRISKNIFSAANESLEVPVEFTYEELHEMQYENWKEIV